MCTWIKHKVLYIWVFLNKLEANETYKTLFPTSILQELENVFILEDWPLSAVKHKTKLFWSVLFKLLESLHACDDLNALLQ